MARRYTLLSVAVSAALAWILVTPSRPVPPVLPADAPQPRDVQILTTPARPVDMVSVTLPPPPAMPAKPEAPRATRMAATATPAPATRAPLAPAPPASTPPPPSKTRPVEPLLPLEDRSPSVPPARAVLTARAKPQARPLAADTLSGPQPAMDDRADPTAPPTRQDADQALSRGRPLLKLLEVGEGPSIEISWPQDSASQARLYDLFRRCYGMQVALINARGELFDGAGATPQPRHLNTDRYSGFVRQSQGRVSPPEAEQIRTLRARHRLPAGSAVRLFPRETDALLLAGLHQLIGPSYRANTTVEARYTVSGTRVHIVDIRSDGAPVRGTVDLSASIKTNCRL